MLNKQTIAALTTLALSGAVMAAQASSTAQQPLQQPEKSTVTSQQPTSVLTGCVYREEDIPGRAPNAAERAGVLEDYILAEVAPRQQQATGTPGATGTSGTRQAESGSMYKLERIDDNKLGALVGKRVEVTGRVDAEAGDSTGRAGTSAPTTQTDRVIGRDRIDLPEFEVVSIREVTGTCPAKPSAR
jgi:hypothetical protein